MGIADFLPRILTSAGRKIDLQQYAQSIEVFHPENDDSNNETNPSNPRPPSTLPPSNNNNNGNNKQTPKRPRPWEDGDDEKQQEHILTPEPKQKKRKREIRRRQRPLRIGVDVSVWISKAAHGFGNMLLDERHLSNYGRAALMEQQQHHQQQEKSGQEADQTMDDTDDENGHVVDSNSVVDDNHQEEKDDPDWKVQGTAHPRRTAKETNATMRRRTIRLVINSPERATAAGTTVSTTTSTTQNSNNHHGGPNTEMIQGYVMTCAQYVMKRLETLRELTKADVLVVLDGKTPPIKAKEVKRRSERRNEAEQTRDDGPTLELDEEGEAATAVPRMKASRRAGAGRYYGHIVSELLNAMRQNQIPFLVAPFEADPQLAYLSNQGYIDLIITEDSDLLAHGPRSVLFKAVDPIGEQRATGILIHDRDLGAGTGNLDLTDFSTLMLAVMFVAAGCDYCEKLKGIGIVAACNIVRGAFFAPRKQDSTPTLEKIFQSLYRNCYHKYISTESKVDFENNFMGALAMYRHPVVYDPVQRKCVVVNDPLKGGIDKELEDYPNYVEICTNRERLFHFVGLPLDARIATHIAEGWINPKTNHPYEGVEIPTYVKYDMEQLKVGLDHGGNDDLDNDEPDTQDVTQEHLGPANPKGANVATPEKGDATGIAHTPDRELGVSPQKVVDKDRSERADGERGGEISEANKSRYDENQRAAEDLGTHFAAANESNVGRTIDTLEKGKKKDSPEKVDKSNRIQQALAEEKQSDDGQDADDEHYETAEDELDGDDDDEQGQAAGNPDTQMNPANAPRNENDDAPPLARPEPFIIDLMDSDSDGAAWATQKPPNGAKPDTVPS